PEEKELKLAVKVVGDYTQAVHKLDAGAAALVEGPYGNFSHQSVSNRKQIWIAGGIGITPFLSMARSLQGDYDIDLFYCVAHVDEAHFRAELARLSSEKGNLRLILHPSDVVGYLTASAVETQVRGLSDKDIFMCGPTAMVEGLASQFRSRGVTADRIHIERFGFGPPDRVPRSSSATSRSASGTTRSPRSMLTNLLIAAFFFAVAVSALLIIKLAL
ncbi:MAG TPA: hypothetical protein VFK89_04875, partial [Actinomycetota bacterium]|nr:hypothetical protein [Actinomycetota bacterium]